MKNGLLDKHKSRLVFELVPGSRQVHGMNYTVTFVPVVKYITFCIILAIAAVHAFIYAPLRKAAYTCIYTLKCMYHVIIV